MKIVSGGQTGVDLAALTFAKDNAFSYGGWVPKGRMNEAGRIPDSFTGLRETETEDVSERTRRNVMASDATVIFVDGAASPGTDLTVQLARKMRKPHLVIDARQTAQTCAAQLRLWLSRTKPKVLNAAGPRHSEARDLGEKVLQILQLALLD